jgi:hypothetical protein
LATPPEASEDVSKDLSAPIIKKQGEAPSQAAPMAHATIVMKGAGATFPFPVYKKWFTNYLRENPALQITYDPMSAGATIFVSRKLRRPLSVTVAPFRNLNVGLGQQPSAVLFVSDPDQTVELPSDLLRCHGLTGAEARLTTVWWKAARWNKRLTFAV